MQTFLSGAFAARFAPAGWAATRRGVRPVTIPEFDEYVFYDAPLHDFHVLLPRT